MEKIIFFGNGPLSEYVLKALKEKCEVIFHARKKEDLTEAVRLKSENPEAHGVLTSFGVLIPSAVLEAFEMVREDSKGDKNEVLEGDFKRNSEDTMGKNWHHEGILNIHPSLLPLYRGASPIESAILNGDREFGVSLMKLAKKMDAGPIYKQASLERFTDELTCDFMGMPTKEFLYKTLAEMGAAMALALFEEFSELHETTDTKRREELLRLTEPKEQDEAKATFCGKFIKNDGELSPETDSAEVTMRKIIAFRGFPKPKYTLFRKKCIILEAHIQKQGETAVLPLKCADGQILSIDRLQPEGRKEMDVKSFLNGYGMKG